MAQESQANFDDDASSSSLTPEQQAAEAEAQNQDPAEPGAVARWAEIWQLPALLLGLLMLGVGLVLVLRTPAPKNDFVGALDDVAQTIQLQQYSAAVSKLDVVKKHIDEAPQADQARYEMLLGDLVASQVHTSPYEFDTPQNNQRIVDAYQRADKLGATFDTSHLTRWIMTLVALGQQDQALAMLKRFGDDQSAERYKILRQMIEKRQTTKPDDVKSIAILLNRFDQALRLETDPKIKRPQEIWAVKTQADMILQGGDNQQGIDMLLRHMAQFQAQGGQQGLEPLMVRLAQAYQSVSDLGKAKDWYQQARTLLKPNPSSELNADVLVGLGQVTLAQGGDAREALEYFSQAQSSYPDTPAYFSALLGRAHCEASLGQQNEAMEHFAQAVKTLVDHHNKPQRDLKALTSLVQEHFQQEVDRENFDQALDYLSQLLPLYSAELPVKLLGELAMIHQKIADQRMTRAQSISPSDSADGPAVPEAVQARKLAYQQAAIHYGKCADYNYQYAQQVSAKDDKAYGQALWAAAANYDKAQMWKRAIEVYSQYVKTRAGDPRQLRAQHKLGLAYLADGQYAQAAELLAQMISDHPRAPEAYISLVPLARAYERMNKTGDALRVLRHVVTDHPTITRESEEYRLALIDLGKLLYQQGQDAQAIPYLAEALQRYGKSEEGAGLRFRLADAYRQSIGALDRKLTEPMNTSDRALIKQTRQDRLGKAQVLFSQVVSELEARPTDSLSPLEKLFYRNAYFYRADCAYALAQYEQAISLYDLAAKRWDKDPSSLVALVQIVNANCELNRRQAARVANVRARERLKQIPESAFKDATIPMTRQHWEDWLKWSSQLDQDNSQARTP